MSFRFASRALVVAAVAWGTGALAGCAAPSTDSEGVEGSADAVKAGELDAYDRAEALAPLLQDAVITAPIGAYLAPGERTRLVGLTTTTECTLTRLTGSRYAGQLPRGSEYLIDHVGVTHGRSASGAIIADGVRGFLDERARDGSHGASASLLLECIGRTPGRTPSIDEIVAAFDAPGGMFLSLQLPQRAPAPAR